MRLTKSIPENFYFSIWIFSCGKNEPVFQNPLTPPLGFERSKRKDGFGNFFGWWGESREGKNLCGSVLETTIMFFGTSRPVKFLPSL